MAHAERAAMLVDGAAYFGAVREAMLKAERSIRILGWDIHTRTRLVGPSGNADDGLPEEFAPFLTALVERKPNLHIHILLWDFAVLYAAEREWLPQWRLDWATPDRVHFCLDSAVPLGASQHQKIVVVDDAVAFSGGLDITIRRWDTQEHCLDNKYRVDPDGVSYPPFHDVQAVADREVAAALSELFCERWKLVTGEECMAPAEGVFDPWPESVTPLFRNIAVGISRTRPEHGEQMPVAEVRQLFLDSIDAAEKYIYIENQFLTFQPVAERICTALRRNPKLEAVFVVPHRPESWIEANTMHHGRVQFARKLKEAGVSDRAKLFCLSVERGRDCVYPMIHSKVMVVDDKLLRIGSANLNNRSMGTDTECDLSFEADSAEASVQIEFARNFLIAEHCKCSVENVASVIEQKKSLIGAITHFGGKGGCLRETHDSDEDTIQIGSYLATIADPEKPVTAQMLTEFMGLKARRREFRRWGIVAGVIVAAIALLWLAASSSEYIEPEDLKSYASMVAKSPWAPFLVIGAFVLAASIIFPINALIIAVSAAFGPLVGFLYSLAGTMLGSLVTYWFGRMLGRRTAKKLIGERLDPIREKIVQNGLMSVATIRLVPVAPFAVVNFVAGVGRIKLFDYLIGTLLGVLPGIALLSFLGNQAVDVILRPNVTNIALLGAAIAGWIGLIVGAQYFAGKLRN